MRPSEAFKLDGRTVFITGAIGGLGAEITRSVLDSGSDVVCFDLPHTAEGTEWDDFESVAKTSGTRVSYFHCDVRNPQQVALCFEEAAAGARFPLRGLVTCAGILRVGPFIDFPIDAARNLFDINTIGTLTCAQAAANIVCRQQVSASFVFIASMSAHVANTIAPRGVSTNSVYAASKAALVQIARNLSAEWGLLTTQTSIRVNTVSPGYIMTPLLEKWLEVNREHNHEDVWTARSMLGRLSVPADYSGPIVFLLSDASAFITGTDLRVDGGHTSC